MKPKDLPAPFQWAERRILLQDGILYVPGCLDDYGAFSFPGFEAIFGNDNPVQVEFCAGNGDWVVERARQEPHVNWVAVEKRFDRVRKIWAKRHNHTVENLFIICGEAQRVTEHYFADNSLQAAFINFPDPWPKKRHAKHRLMHAAFLTDLQRALSDDGAFTFVSDDRESVDRLLEEVNQVTGYHPRFPAPHFIQEWPEYGESWFSRLWRKKGKLPHYLEFQCTP